MTAIRTRKKSSNFVVLDKSCLKESKMSWAAKGLHTYLMSLPEDWKINTHDLIKRSRNGRDAVRALLSELEEFGYLIRETIRVSGKFAHIEYVVYETPQSLGPEKPVPVIPGTECPALDFSAPENSTQLNNKYNKYKNNKIITAAIATALPQVQEKDISKIIASAAADNKNLKRERGNTLQIL